MAPARRLHDRMLELDIHPDHDSGMGHSLFKTDLSPCDGCYDLWMDAKVAYEAMWQGPRKDQRHD